MRTVSGWWVLLAFFGIAAVFVLAEHRAHLWGVVPWLLLLACPLLHFFMHGGHGGHGPGGSHGHGEGGHGPEDGGSAGSPGAGKA
ncbi:MAG TPA: DUF2933 domain-containing protein [Methylomirabilota bacterium]|nr:DUF2933 domain-containing protein [Methylomirabilota bacterium]